MPVATRVLTRIQDLDDVNTTALGQVYTIPALNGTIPLGAGTLTIATVNDVTGATHTHAITASSNPGAAASLLATNASGYLQLAGLGVGVATSATGQVIIKAGADATVPLIARSNSVTQTGNLQQWQTSAGIIQAFMSVEGSLILDPAGVFGYTSVTTGMAVGRAFSTASSVVGLAFIIQNSSTGSITGINGTARIRGASNIATVSACNLAVASHPASAGNITNAYGLYVDSPTLAGAGTIANIYGIRILNQIGGTSTNYALYTGTGLIRLGDQLSIIGSADRQQLLVTGFTTQAVATTVAQVTRNDAAAGVSAMLGLTALGSGANGDGGSILLKGKSSTTAAQSMAKIAWLWSDATHATRKADLVLSAWDTAEREFLRGRGMGAAAGLAFYGGTPVVRGAALAAQLTTITHTAPGVPDYAIQDLVAGGFGFVTKDEGNTVLSVVANLQTRVAQLEARLGSATGVNLFV